MFPVHTLSLKRLLSFDFKKLYSFNDAHTELTVSNYSYTTKEETILSKISVIRMIDDKDEDHVTMVTRTLTGCEQMYTCTVLHKRTEFILELEVGLPTPVLLAACAQTNFSPGSSTNKFTMLLKENLGSEPCPVSGRC